MQLSISKLLTTVEAHIEARRTAHEKEQDAIQAEYTERLAGWRASEQPILIERLTALLAAAKKKTGPPVTANDINEGMSTWSKDRGYRSRRGLGFDLLKPERKEYVAAGELAALRDFLQAANPEDTISPSALRDLGFKDFNRLLR